MKRYAEPDHDSAPKVVPGRWAHIDALRALAVLLVVVAHAGLEQVVPGGSGVTIFFVISGFVITTLLLRERERTGGFRVGAFYLRRLLKLGPPFLVVVLLPTLVYALVRPVDWTHVAAQVFFGFNWIYMQGHAHVLPGSGVVWSLSIEEQFYIAFALLWIVMARLRNPLGPLVVVSAVAVVYATATRVYLGITDLSQPRSYYGTDTRLDGIALGVLAAALLWRARSGAGPATVTRWLGTRREWMPVVGVLLHLVSLTVRDEFFRETFRYSLQGIATCLVVVYGLEPGGGRPAVLFSRAVSHRLVQTLGLASYSIYLVHPELIIVLDQLWGSIAAPLRIVLDVVLSCAAGVLLWRMVEVPVLRWRTGRSAPPTSADPVGHRPADALSNSRATRITYCP